MGLGAEFRKFVMRGNVVDLAVGVIIGAAFGKIVTSLVADILMPPIGLLVGGVNFTDVKFTLRDAIVNSTGQITKPAVTLNLGNFIQTVVDFIITATSIFGIVRVMNALQRQKEKAPVVAELSKTEKLLTEIRDSLKPR